MTRGGEPDGIPQGRVHRVAPLARLAAETAGGAVAAGVRRRTSGPGPESFHARTAERYVEVLGQSKGALMKAGQMLSFSALLPVIPPEFRGIYIAALERLQSRAPPMAPALTRSVVEAELGGALGATFVEFERDPFAAASIGQVHRARLRDGRRTAVKVQYPGVAAAMQADLDNAQLLTTLLRMLFRIIPGGVAFDVEGAASEVRERLLEELDYGIEARNQAAFASRYRGHPFIRVPALVPELCTSRIIVQELASGSSWREAVSADQDQRDCWGEAITRFFYRPAYRDQPVHGDPHPGNYLFHDDGTVTVLDYGCVRHFPPGSMATVNAANLASMRSDAIGVWHAMIEGGVMSMGGPAQAEDIYRCWADVWEIYLADQPLRVTPEFAERTIRATFSPLARPRLRQSLSTPPELTLFTRITLGVMSVLSGLRASADWRLVIDELLGGAPPLTPMGRAESAFFAEADDV